MRGGHSCSEDFPQESAGLQGIVDAVVSELDQAETLVQTPDISPSKPANGANGISASAAKKQHSTPPIKDIRTSSLCAPHCSLASAVHLPVLCHCCC